MTKMFLIATALLGAATPAFAREARPVAGVDVGGGGSGSVGRVEAPAQRYCIVDTITGSRIPHKVCATRADWAYLGTDPFAK